jgi:hypothetical protein
LNPLTKTALDLCETLFVNEKALKDMKYYILGQICIKEAYRGKHIFDNLYQEHKRLFSNSYDCIVTEISPPKRQIVSCTQKSWFSDNSFIQRWKNRLEYCFLGLESEILGYYKVFLFNEVIISHIKKLDK